MSLLTRRRHAELAAIWSNNLRDFNEGRKFRPPRPESWVFSCPRCGLCLAANRVGEGWTIDPCYYADGWVERDSYGGRCPHCGRANAYPPANARAIRNWYDDDSSGKRRETSMNRGTRILVAVGITLVVYRFGLAVIGEFASALVVGLVSGGIG